MIQGEVRIIQKKGIELVGQDLNLDLKRLAREEKRKKCLMRVEKKIRRKAIISFK